MDIAIGIGAAWLTVSPLAALFFGKVTQLGDTDPHAVAERTGIWHAA